MQFGGLIKNSFIDYPGHIAAVVFTIGCNMSCYYCHNHDLAQNKRIDEDEVIDFLKSRRGLLDAVVISGGEPTLHLDLAPFIIKCRELGYKIKLDTNGSNPWALKELLDRKFLDYVAMDIKTTLGEYAILFDIYSEIAHSMSIIESSGIPYEYRTTLVKPYITLANIVYIGMIIKKESPWYLQRCNIKTAKHPERLEEFTEEEYQKILLTCKKTHDKVFLR